MKTVLTKGLEPDVAKEIRGDFKSSHLLRKRITEILREKIENNRTSMRAKTNYDKPGWEYFIADATGYERALYEFISLLDENEEN